MCFCNLSDTIRTDKESSLRADNREVVIVQKLKSKWKLVFVPVVILVTGVCYLCFREQEKPAVQYSTGYMEAGEEQNALNEETLDTRNTGAEAIPHEEVIRTTITVHVCGAVQTPGVYELQKDSRVWEAITLAGGVLPEADSDYVNQARRILDGERIYIPYSEETADYLREQRIAGEDRTTEENEKSKVNINTASAEELETLPGIGSKRAESIIRYREKNGEFQAVEDIMKVSGIKDAAFEKIKDAIFTGYE